MVSRTRLSMGPQAGDFFSPLILQASCFPPVTTVPITPLSLLRRHFPFLQKWLAHQEGCRCFFYGSGLTRNATLSGTTGSSRTTENVERACQPVDSAHPKLPTVAEAIMSRVIRRILNPDAVQAGTRRSEPKKQGRWTEAARRGAEPASHQQLTI